MKINYNGITLKMGMMLLVTGLVLAGCNDKNKPTQNSLTDDKPSPKSLINSPKSQDSPTASESKPIQDSFKPDHTVPLADYWDLNRETAGMALTYIVVAKSQEPLTDDDKLNQLSPAYYNEADVFKKRELAKIELPRIEVELSKYKKNNYYALPLSDFLDKKPLQFSSMNIGLEQYDFNTRSFPLGDLFRHDQKQYCWDKVLTNQQNAKLEILPSKFPCALHVNEEAQAKLIEATRAQNNLKLRGTLYLFIPRVENGVALAVVSHAYIELLNIETKAVLASFNL